MYLPKICRKFCFFVILGMRNSTILHPFSIKKTAYLCGFLRFMGTTGLEPVRCFHQRILSPLRLPIPPCPRKIKMEVPAGLEPAITELQSVALPLG